MPEISEVIDEICRDAEHLQKKFSSLTKSGRISIAQSKAIDEAADGLRFWRRTHLENLAKEFSEKHKS